MGFASEADLVEAAVDSPELLAFLEREPGTVFLREPKGLFGRPDVVFATLDVDTGDWVCARVIALEMKLRNWKRALVQAFRYQAFAHSAYVVMDSAHIAPAAAKVDRFRRANVGLLAVDDDGVVQVVHQPTSAEPMSDRLFRKLKQIAIAQADTEA